MRRALAIQLIINKEWGLAMNENPSQGSFIIEELTGLVEEAVLQEFERISERGGRSSAAPWKPVTSAAGYRMNRCITSTGNMTEVTPSSVSTRSSTLLRKRVSAPC